MGSTYRFLAEAPESEFVQTWFSSLPEKPEVVHAAKYTALHFSQFGPLLQAPDGRIDQVASPVVTIYRPRRERGVFLTAGEVHFLASPLRNRFPGLHSVAQRFKTWLDQFPAVFSGSSVESGEHDYYLEGTLRNYRIPIHALPLAFEALKGGQYFVSDDESPATLDKLCRTLRLRGIQCGDA